MANAIQIGTPKGRAKNTTGLRRETMRLINRARNTNNSETFARGNTAQRRALAGMLRDTRAGSRLGLGATGKSQGAGGTG